ncbi:hypothetical protein BX600DRAFT_504709 [Xylariales sp. PMI_506]|nr:hypothetical protein BX600DRAFT_504709 [Xylariales sp. PMI_506]
MAGEEPSGHPMVDKDLSTVADYAIYHGLTIDFESLLVHHMKNSIDAGVSDALYAGLLSPRGLYEDKSLRPLSLSSWSIVEYPIIPKEAMQLLSSIITENKTEEPADLSPVDPQGIRQSTMKLELPLLSSDHDSDYRQLQRDTRTRRMAYAQNITFPLEPLVMSLDEGLEFPDSVYEYREQLVTRIHKDYLPIGRETCQYLGSIIERSSVNVDRSYFLSNELAYCSTASKLKLTPPLSQGLEDYDVFVPPDEFCQVPLLSDATSLFEDDLKNAHVALLHTQSSSPQIAIPELSPIPDTPIIISEPSKVDWLKVDGPLTPSICSRSLPYPIIDIPEATRGLELDDGVSISASGCAVDPEDILTDNLATELLKGAIRARQMIEQERLEPAAAIYRLSVPMMDFAVNDMPKMKNNQPNDHLQAYFKSVRLIPTWPGDMSAEMQLRWNPFPRQLGRITVQEVVEDRDLIRSFVDTFNSKNVPDSSLFIWKRPGLSILSTVDKDENVEINESPTRQKDSLASLVKKRKLELDSMNTEVSLSPVKKIKIRNNISPPGNRLFSQDTIPHLLVDVGDPSTASKLLANFVDFRTWSKRKSERSAFFNTPSGVEDKSITERNTAATDPAKAQIKKQHGSVLPNLDTSEPCPVPDIDAYSQPTSIIMNLTIERGIASRLETLLPAINMIERDFDQWNGVTWDGSSVARSPIISSLAAEADVIVSPKTGIVITTRVKIIQKPLPGRKGRTVICDRIEKVAARYEHLIILVSESNPIDETSRGLSESECMAYAEFLGFAHGLDSNVLVQYVGGGDETMSKWLAFFIKKHSNEASQVHHLLITDETTWELCLRRAGMNAFAAQVILALLKAPDDTPQELFATTGLAGFINMNATERVQQFSQIMGGSRVLQRVGMAFGSRWDYT